MPVLPPSRFQPAPVLPVVLRASGEQLARFRMLMAREGWTVHLGRMGLDLRYARGCIALAHTSAHDPLRELAVQLFEACASEASDGVLHR